MTLERKTKTKIEDQKTLFEIEPNWRDEWWGMPEFEMGDARPQYKITINFMTAKDVEDFAKVTGIPVTARSDSAWFPHQEPLKGQYYYDGPKADSRYPICIPSKGRYDCQKTGKALDKLGVSYKFFVEEAEGDLYKQYLGEDKVVVMPFSNLGQGSIPARNFIWDWARERGFKRHWTVDDNIQSFARCHNNRRLCVYGGSFFNAMEDFVDRYENVAMAGPHHKGFVMDRDPNLTPVLWNSRIYSCILLDTTLPDKYSWRGRYNEDTDLSLRLLKDGYCTLLFRALCMDKGTTVGVKNAKPMKGGNTDNVYNSSDFRKAFADSLKEQHPDCVEVVWKFNRWHHHVDYSLFKKNRPILRANITKTQSINNYNMELIRSNEQTREASDGDSGEEQANCDFDLFDNQAF
jgi:hypothetical protein